MNEMIIANDDDDDDDGDGMSIGNKRSRSDNNSSDIITKRTCHYNNDDDVNAYYNESKQSHNHWTSSFNVDVYSYFINSTNSTSNDSDSNSHYQHDDTYSEQYQETKRDYSSSSSSLLRNRNNYSMAKSSSPPSSSLSNKIPSSLSSSVIHRPSYLSLQMFGKKWSSSLSSDNDDYNGLTCPSSPYRDMKSSSSYYNFKNILTETDDVNIIIEPFFTLNKGFIGILLLLLILLYKTLSLSSYYYYTILITSSILYFNCSYISSSLSSLLSFNRKVDYY